MKPTHLTSKNIFKLPTGRYRLEPGIYLRVTGNSRSWTLIQQKNGVKQEIGLGSAHQVSITEVRAKASQLRERLDLDQTPIVEQVLFKDFIPKAFERICFIRQLGKSTQESWKSSIRQLIHYFGNKEISKISSLDIANYFSKRWVSNHEISKIRLFHLRGLLSIAVKERLITHNPADWENALENYLPSSYHVRKGRPKNHWTALSAADAQKFVHLLKSSNSNMAPVMLCIILTACRKNEISKAKWKEYNPEEKILRVPPERRKDRYPEDFLIPLPRQVQEILENLPRNSEWIFPSTNGRPRLCLQPQFLPEKVIQYFDHFTLHGFRSTFSDWCAENNKPYLVSEKCLMHSVGSQTYRAYQRSDLLEQRRQLLQEWADFLLEE